MYVFYFLELCPIFVGPILCQFQIYNMQAIFVPRVRNLTTHLTLMRTLTSSTQFMLSTRQTRLSSHFLSTSSNLVGTDKFIIQTNYPCTAVEFRKDKIILSYGCTIDTIQDFLCKLGMKPHIHLVEIRIFSLNRVIVRPTKIIKDLCEAST